MQDGTSKVIKMPRKSGGELTVAQAATELGVNEQRVRALIASGRLNATKRTVPGILGETWRIAPEDLDAVRERKTGRPRKESQP